MILENLIDTVETATSLSAKPYETQNADSCIVYQWSTVSDDGAVEVDKLQIRIIGKTLTEVLANEAKVKNALIAIGDTCKVNGINSIVLNGGGTLKDFETNTMQSINYFYITKKSEVN